MDDYGSVFASSDAIDSYMNVVGSDDSIHLHGDHPALLEHHLDGWEDQNIKDISLALWAQHRANELFKHTVFHPADDEAGGRRQRELAQETLDQIQHFKSTAARRKSVRDYTKAAMVMHGLEAKIRKAVAHIRPDRKIHPSVDVDARVDALARELLYAYHTNDAFRMLETMKRVVAASAQDGQKATQRFIEFLAMSRLPRPHILTAAERLRAAAGLSPAEFAPFDDLAKVYNAHFTQEAAQTGARVGALLSRATRLMKKNAPAPPKPAAASAAGTSALDILQQRLRAESAGASAAKNRS